VDSIDAWVWWLIGAAGLGIALVVTAMPELGMLALGAVAGAVTLSLIGALLGTLSVSSDYNAATQGLILIALLTLRSLTADRRSEQ